VKASSKVRVVAVALLAALLLVTAACGDDDNDASGGGGGGGGGESTTLRLGYFPNVTHATAIVGVDKGIYAKALGSNKLETSTFKDGTEASEALSAGAIDATYIGSGPSINLFQKSKGEAIRVVSGAASGGAALVVNDSIQSPEDLAGKTLSTPKLGNTQDVSLRAWLKDQGYETDLEGGGDPKIAPQENSLTLDAFVAGDIDGAWVPEPWASRLVIEGKGHVLVDERDIWPNGEFLTTVLIVAKPFLDDHPDVVKQLLAGQVEANKWVNDNSEEAKTITNAGIKKITDKELAPEVIDSAWKTLTFTDDPLPDALKGAATQAKDVGLLDTDDIEGIYDLTPLNAALKAAGEKEYSDA
jgi:NitT/TauT family transport system substrate-binding protein